MIIAIIEENFTSNANLAWWLSDETLAKSIKHVLYAPCLAD